MCIGAQGVDAISDSHITEHSIRVRQWALASSHRAGQLPDAEAGGGERSVSANGMPGQPSSAAVERRRTEAVVCQRIPVLTLPPADADSTAVTVIFAQWCMGIPSP